MPNLLALGFRGSAVIGLGFGQSAGLMGRTHVTQIICASKLKGSYVLRNPAIAHAVDSLIAEYASTSRCFPHLKTSVRRRLPASGRSHIFNVDESHDHFIPRFRERKSYRLASMRLQAQENQ
jgi:hypothetical protein